MCKLMSCPYEDDDDEVQCELCLYNEIGEDSDFDDKQKEVMKCC